MVYIRSPWVRLLPLRMSMHAPKRLRAGIVVCLLLSIFPASLPATSIVPITDSELRARADVVVYGIVQSSEVTVDEQGRPETLTFIEPISVLKGRLSGSLVLHQLGGILPDGRFLKMWGRPEYVPGREVIVFAIARPEGEYQTAEMMLGKFEVREDSTGARFAVPDLTIGSRSGLDVYTPRPRKAEQAVSRLGVISREDPGMALDSESGPRALARFLEDLRTGHFGGTATLPTVNGELLPVVHRDSASKVPQWGYISNILFRYTNGATNAWTISGTANVTGGGTAEALAALAAWTNEPNSNINYTAGSGPSIVTMSAPSSGCGWSTCVDGNGGVIGCGGPNGGGSNSWRGDTYNTISGGHVEIRPFCTTDQWRSILQSVIMHELGHTLGLGHSDQNVSPHDTCRGDEAAATMFSFAQSRSTLGTDDTDAARWLYGDGLTSCTTGPPSVTGIGPTFGATAGGTVVTIAGGNFVPGSAVTIGGVPATNVSVLSASSLTATTGPHAAGAADVVVTNPDLTSATKSGAYTYKSGAGFYTVTPCRVLDTRNPTGPLGGPALAAGAERVFVVAGQCGIPSTARSISANVTVTQSTTGPAYVTVSQADLGPPVVSTVNYATGQTRANSAQISLGAAGDVRVKCGQASGTTHFIIDVNGYFQ